MITVSIAAGLLVMVSSELVVLLIVCVGINTGSAQQETGNTLTLASIFSEKCLLYVFMRTFPRPVQITVVEK